MKGEDLYRSINACSPIAVLTIDVDGRVLTWNRAAERLFGWSEQEILGQLLPVRGDQWGEFEELRESVCSGESFSGREVVRVNRQGQPIDVSISAAPLRDEDGKVIALMSTLEDIRPRKRAEQALRESKQRFRSLFSAAATGIVATDTQGRFLEANPAFCEMLEYDESELRQLDVLSLTHPPDRPRNRQLIEQLVQGEIDRFAIEKRYLSRHDEPIWVRSRVGMVSDSQGRPSLLLAVVEDIRARKLAETLLHQLNEELEQRVHPPTGINLHGGHAALLVG